MGEKAIALSKQNDISLHNVELYGLLVSAYEKSHNYKAALKNQKLHHAYNDSLFNLQSTEKIAEIQTKYDIDAAENENIRLKNENEIKSLIIAKQRNQQFLLVIILLLVIVTVVFSLLKMKKEREVKALLTGKNKEIKLKSDELEKMNRDKDKLFSIIAHDLRNPSNSIVGALGLLKNEYSNLDEKARLNLINLTWESATATTNLLNELLEWANIQRGGIKLEKKLNNIASLVEESVDVYLNLASQKKISLTCNAVSSEEVFVDKRTIQIAINNLINNAIKFTQQKGSVSISTYSKNGSVEVEVRDTGIGISPEILDSLFKIEEPQSRPGTNREPGTGLGLILCKEYVEMNGGTISVTSEENKGSCFRVIFSASEK